MTRDRGVRRRTRHESAAAGGPTLVVSPSAESQSVPLLNTFSVVVRPPLQGGCNLKNLGIPRSKMIFFQNAFIFLLAYPQTQVTNSGS